jgi:hypothetical protein
VQPKDTYELMVAKAKEKKFQLSLLIRSGKKSFCGLWCNKNTSYLFAQQKGEKLTVEYIGVIDDNYEDASAVKKAYLADAVDALLDGKNQKLLKQRQLAVL